MLLIEITIFEGFSQKYEGKTGFLRSIVSGHSIKKVVKIIFKVIHSTTLHLFSNKNLNLVSFDIGTHRYVNLGKELKLFLERLFPTIKNITYIIHTYIFI